MVFADIDRSKIDDCLYYLLEADHFYRELVEIHPYDVLFESEQGKEAEAHNNQVIKKTKGSLRKAVDALIAFIKNIGKAVSNFVREVFMSGEEHRRYEAYKKALKEHPELGNVKVTVKDFRDYEKFYDGLIDQIDQKIRLVEGGTRTDLEKFVKEINTKLMTNGTVTAKVVTLNALLNMCANSKDYAERLQQILNKNEAACESIRKTLGEEKGNEYLKTVDMYAESSSISLHRLKANVHRKKASTMKECFIDSLNELEGIISKGKVTKTNQFMVNALRDNEETGDSLVGLSVDIATGGARKPHDVKAATKNAKNEADKKVNSFKNKLGKKMNRGIDPSAKFSIF